MLIMIVCQWVFPRNSRAELPSAVLARGIRPAEWACGRRNILCYAAIICGLIRSYPVEYSLIIYFHKLIAVYSFCEYFNIFFFSNMFSVLRVYSSQLKVGYSIPVFRNFPTQKLKLNLYFHRFFIKTVGIIISDVINIPDSITIRVIRISESE